jgi:hypothetical protein
MSHDLREICFQCVERCVICSWTSADHDIYQWSCRQQACANKFPQTTLEPIAVHSGFRVTRHDDSNACMCERGSKYPNVKMPRSDSLPLSHNFLDVRTAREPMAPRKGKVWKRRRKLWA